MEVTSTSSVKPETTSSPPAVQDNSSDAVAADFETFLTLLTTQMRNQDPLKPLESTEFVAQLASFSAVEQQVKANDTLAQIQNLLGGPGSVDLTSWIGQNVQVLHDPVFDGSPIELLATTDRQANRAELVVRNASGQETQRLSLPLGSNVLEWAGVDSSGEPIASGKYNLTIESFKNDQPIESHQAPIYQTVKEARISDATTLLILSDGSSIAADQITAVRATEIP